MTAHETKILGEGLTYDDVLLVPAYSEVLPREVNIQSKFSKNITLNVPIVSAAMDTVTESSMAIAIAREGGIGVLHKNMTIEQQAVKVRRVKRAESGMIIDPVTLNLDAQVKDAKRLMAEHSIGGIPIVDQEGHLKGIVTNRDLRFEKDNERAIVEVMTSENLITTAEGTSLSQAEVILQENKIEKLPVVTNDNKLIGLITFRDITKLTQKPIANKDTYGRLRVAAAVGVTADAVERVEALVNAGVDAVVVDTAHGHTQGVVRVLKSVKEKFPGLDVVVGNIATADAAKYLVEAGADAVKVGIGPGSICTTRVVAGVGFPQFSAVLEVAAALKGTGIPVIADGGIRYTGDIPKAIAAGADCVMLGSLLAGTKESPGETIIYEGRKYKTYRGMGSVEAMKTGSKDRYFQDVEDDIKKLVPEGIVGRVPYKGELFESIHQFVGGLRAGMGYCGAKDVEALKENGRFVKITSSGIHESHPHDVTITKESPNYSR
ncbi:MULTISPECIES: IMP dehydrogenase [Leeuwenhoekiella]|jgi:IMP dehydrogenase|uniref:Inosine-5'-monophosphate dehydrogenase n=1 Tax=Leeuwenhoekiella blandensis (strain CECT 7118 / CCUG 51940 / KCTC 22103 / MED217) TaxID=398720 RepID=A3XN98_LEEBM|nr:MULTISPECIES: IMP dehydrogenase [Leeuwenhoekiella]EAQ48976.1 putative inosine-5'-monophosphate dehydrogenase [Leeuwenhoekiella blandensis MED217]MAO44856.1 IMP dehydrogenase [Leeuwenhoekiella sp.]MBQ52249.1 IMP dehydrogenase [Leeuwenhoekiella sp.]HBT09173.1 IMP dehydrogenase [Leeuwenhoekiella sp.]|tara:strand:+ start:266 stop:1738 length:1473 start_codon:yes stop_codon:yes gene_type:complete